MYDNGNGVPQDYVEAYKCWNLAAKEFKEMIEEKMTRQQIAEGQRLSGELFTIISKEKYWYF
ncbi:MAG: SEL1-like repeat protein [Kordiimonadaceae bacterium]|nr:SEL1-like repeat protein [Kordiimonadaceae bacterium]